MCVRSIGRVIAIAIGIRVFKTAIIEISFDARATCTVRVVEIPSQGGLHEVETSYCLTGCDVSLDFKRLAEANEVTGQFRGDSTHWTPVCGQLVVYGRKDGWVSDAEQESHAIGNLRID
jgi:hypothetical protein